MESISPITLPKYKPEQSSLHHFHHTNFRKERFTDTYQWRKNKVPNKHLCQQSLTFTYQNHFQAVPQDFFHISQSSSAFTILFQYLYIYIITPSLLEPLSNSLLSLQASASTKIISKSWKLAHEVSLSDPGVSNQEKWRANRAGGGGTVSPAEACDSSRLWNDCKWSYRKTVAHTHMHTLDQTKLK